MYYGNLKECVFAFKSYFPNVKVVIMGCRRNDPGCQNLCILSHTNNGWPDFLRLNPILEWTYDEVWDFILSRRISYPILYDNGYTSIGDKLSTTKNPFLLTSDAYSLINASFERAGRQKIVSKAKQE